MTMRGQLNLKQLRAYRAWPWESIMQGVTDNCVKWGARDLHHLDASLKWVPGRTAVVQAGGNIGLFPKRLAEEFRTVYTFEPSANLFEKLCRNVEERNVVKLQAALGDRRGPVGVKCSRRDGSKKPIHEGLTHVVADGVLPCLLLDDLALPVIDLIYLDIEGFEWSALMGSRSSILRCRPTVVVEINRNAREYGQDPDKLVAQIENEFHLHHVHQVDSDHVFIPEERAP